MSEKFFYRNSNSRKAKMTVCVRWRVAYSFKDPIANAPAATARRLASTSLVSGFHPILSKNIRVTTRTPVQKRSLRNQNLS
jgi:hypothetical protein